MYLTDKDSIQSYTGNTPTGFTVKLSQVFKLPGTWSLSLLDLTIKKSYAARIYILCSIVVNSFVGEQRYRVLRHVVLRSGQSYYSFGVPHYVNVENTYDINTINISILNADTLEPLSVGLENVACTLHLKRDTPPYQYNG